MDRLDDRWTNYECMNDGCMDDDDDDDSDGCMDGDGDG